MNKATMMMMMTALAALTACPAQPQAPMTMTSTAPMGPGASAAVPAAVPPPALPPPAATPAAATTDPALLAVARAYKDEPGYEQMTARLRERAKAKAKACEAQEEEEGGCDDAFYLSCSAGEYVPFALDRIEGSTAFYTSQGRPFSRVVFQQEGGTWKVDAASCGASKPEMPWAH